VREKIMRWVVIILTITLSLILDQYKFSGHYREHGVEKTSHVIAALNPFSRK
jgi:hypothetical protein